MVKRLPATQETRVRSLGGEDPLEKETATHSSTLAWKIPWTGEPSRLRTVHGVTKSWTQLSNFTFSFFLRSNAFLRREDRRQGEETHKGRWPRVDRGRTWGWSSYKLRNTKATSRRQRLDRRGREYSVLWLRNKWTRFRFFGGVFDHATQHAGSQFLHQGLSPHALQWERGPLTSGPPGNDPSFCSFKSAVCSTLIQQPQENTLSPILENSQANLSNSWLYQRCLHNVPQQPTNFPQHPSTGHGITDAVCATTTTPWGRHPPKQSPGDN